MVEQLSADSLFQWATQQWQILPVGWQGFVFFGGWCLLWLPIAIPLAIFLQWRPFQPITPAQKLPLLGSLYLLAPGVLALVARLEDHSFGVYGVTTAKAMGRSGIIGVLIGVAGLTTLYALQAALGQVQWQSPTPDLAKVHLEGFPSSGTQALSWLRGAFGNPILPTLMTTLLVGVGVGFVEELIFRGFLQHQFQARYSDLGAAMLTSFIFALLHLVWEGRENIPQLPGLWLMGMVLTLARWVDGGQLGLAWGLHAGWIWTIASLDSLQGLHYPQRQLDWLTGGGKPLAGLMGIGFLLATGIFLGLWLGR